MTRFLAHFKSNVIAYLALFVALGGTSYAALRLPAGSVGNRQLKNHSVSPVKLDRNGIAGYVRAWVKIDATGTVVGSRPRARLLTWNPNGGLVSWGDLLPRGHATGSSCFAVASTSISGPAASYASAFVTGVRDGSKQDVVANVHLSAPQQGVDVAVICPQP